MPYVFTTSLMYQAEFIEVYIYIYSVNVLYDNPAKGSYIVQVLSYHA